MRIHVVYDKTGAIVGGGVTAPEPLGRAPRSGPDTHDHQHTAEFEVPSELEGFALHDLVEQLRVDVAGKEHKLTAKRR